MAVDHEFHLDLITLKEAAQLLRVSEVTIRRWLKQGRLRAYHVGPRAVRFRRDERHALLVPTQRARQPEHDYPSPITGDRGQVGPPTADEVRRTLAALAS